ncbi:MAG: hypothetical protein WCD81_00685 [Candidatus Bathyarchaeia archaeon]
MKVNLGELKDERESLASFLRTTLKVEITSYDNNVLVDSEKSSPQELQRLVNKFIYHRKLNNKYWASLEGGTVRINNFKVAKSEGQKKKGITPSTIKHGW